MKFEIVEINKIELRKFDDIAQEFAIEKIVVENDNQYRGLAELLKKVKSKEKEIKAVFKEPKQKAYKTHREICKEEKKYLDHLKKFEEKAKEAIAEYLLTKEEANTVLNPVDIPKVKGIVVQDVFKWEIVDESKVPFIVGKTQIWKIDEKAIDDLVQSSCGTIKIPGIKIYKEKRVSVRTND